MVYLLLFTILMNSYQQLGVSLGKQLEWMTQFMKGLAPAYFVAVSAASGAVTASVFYQGVSSSGVAGGMASSHFDSARG